MSFISQFHQQIRTIMRTSYKGPFDYKRVDTKAYRYPHGINRSALEEEYEDIKSIRQLDIKEVSPFHMVWRSQKMGGLPWTEKIVLRRLGLHQKEVNTKVILPNTPHHNRLLWEVKHLIRLKPVSFPDGVPTDDDVGCAKVDASNGVMSVNPSHKVSDYRIEKAKSHDIFYGRYLREYLKWCSGMFGKSLPHADILQIDGQHISEFKKKISNANRHQHILYEND